MWDREYGCAGTPNCIRIGVPVKMPAGREHGVRGRSLAQLTEIKSQWVRGYAMRAGRAKSILLISCIVHGVCLPVKMYVDSLQ
jgi:hypothetical protein